VEDQIVVPSAREVPPSEVCVTVTDAVKDLGLERLDSSVVAGWQKSTGVFTSSSYCNPLTGLPGVSFASKDCSGHHVLIDPPPNRMEQHLAHYVACKNSKPESTSACIMVPRYEGGSHWRRHLQGMRLLHEYPSGTPLKFACQSPSTQQAADAPAPTPLVPSKYPIQVWYDPRRGINASTCPGQVIQAYFPGDSAPRKKGATHTLKAAAQGTWLVFEATVGHRSCKVLLDTGATANFMSLQLAEALSSPTKPTKHAPVHTAGGEVAVQGTCQPRIKLQGHRSSPSCLVLPELLLDYDLVLGKPWLIQHKVILNCESGSCTLAHKGSRITLTPVGTKEPAGVSHTAEEPDAPHSLCTAQRLAKEWAKTPGARMFAMVLKPAGETDQHGPTDTQKPTVPPELQMIIHEYSAVLEEIPDGLPPHCGEPHERMPDVQPHETGQVTLDTQRTSQI